jgi:hypothetical protein
MGKDFEGSDRDVIDALPRNLPAGNEENHEDTPS